MKESWEAWMQRRLGMHSKSSRGTGVRRSQDIPCKSWLALAASSILMQHAASQGGMQSLHLLSAGSRSTGSWAYLYTWT